MESCIGDIIKDTSSRACVLQLLAWPCQHIPRIITELDVGRPDIAARCSKIPQKNYYCVCKLKLLLVLIEDEILGISWMCVGSQTPVLLCVVRAGPSVVSLFLCVWTFKLPLFSVQISFKSENKTVKLFWQGEWCLPAASNANEKGYNSSTCIHGKMHLAC